MNTFVSVILKSRQLAVIPQFNYHFPEQRFGQVGHNPAVTAKRLIKCVGERLRKYDPERWETTPITFETHWRDEAGFADIATSIHVHDAIEKEFGIQIKDRAILLTDIAGAFYLVTLEHNSH